MIVRVSVVLKRTVGDSDTSLWSSGICAVLIASIKFSVDCSLCLDWSVKACSTVVKYLDSWYVGDPQNETI